jgi:hypothetical protein
LGDGPWPLRSGGYSGGGFAGAGPLGLGDLPAGPHLVWDRTAGATTPAFAIEGKRYILCPAGRVLSLLETVERVPRAAALELVRKGLARRETRLAGAPALDGNVLPDVEDGTLVLLRIVPPPAQRSAPAPAPEAPPPPPAPARKPVKDGWIEFEVLDEEGRPRGGDTYKLELPDGRVLSGKVAANGIISVHGIDPGDAKLTLTEIDSETWE